MPEVKKIFIGGINSDDAEFLVNPKEYLGALNIRFHTSENGEVGRITNIEGTVEKDQTLGSSGAETFTQPAGVNRTIGAIEDTAKRRVIWFNKNSNGDDRIYCYDADTDLIYTVLKSSDIDGGLNFNGFIHSLGIVDGVLYWTDDTNQPRRWNIDAGIKTYHSAYETTQEPYDVTSPLSQYQITVIRPQPTLPILATYIGDATATADPDGYRASYRFVYRDGEVSTFTTHSNVPKKLAITGYIEFKIPSSQPIPQDVEKVELAVRHPDGTMFIYKTWSRTDDAAEIDAHDNASTPLTFNFTENQIGVAVDNATATKPYDSVPILAGTLEIARDRLFMGDTESGRNAPKSVSLSATLAEVANENNIKVFKSGSQYRLGIVFYDEAGRYCGVVPGPTVTIPDRKEASGPWTGYINWALINNSSEIPEWAHSYSIVRTKARKTSFFMQYRPNKIEWVTKNSSNEYEFAATAPNNPYGIALKSTELFNMGLGYSYQEGDVVNMYIGSTVHRLKVLDTYSDYIIVESKVSISTFGVVEIYTPQPATENEYYFEVGNRFLITDPGTPSRAYDNWAGSLTGDVYVMERLTVVSGVDVYYHAETMNLNDKTWKNWYTDAARPMIVNTKKVKRLPTNICWSNVRTESINGLSSFDVLDFKILPKELSTVKRLTLTSKAEAEGTVMLAIGEQETASLYIGESQLFDANGSSFVAKSSGVIGQVNPLRGSYGTIHPESAFKWNGQVVFFDATKGCWIRYDVNGLVPISNFKMRKYFKKAAEDILKNFHDSTEYDAANVDLPIRVLGMVDPFHGEFLSCMPRMSLKPKNTVLSDMEISRETYAFTTAPSCDLSLTVEDLAGCSLIIIAE
jgi:hypothetical protein